MDEMEKLKDEQIEFFKERILTLEREIMERNKVIEVLREQIRICCVED